MHARRKRRLPVALVCLLAVYSKSGGRLGTRAGAHGVPLGGEEFEEGTGIGGRPWWQHCCTDGQAYTTKCKCEHELARCVAVPEVGVSGGAGAGVVVGRGGRRPTKRWRKIFFLGLQGAHSRTLMEWCKAFTQSDQPALRRALGEELHEGGRRQLQLKEIRMKLWKVNDIIQEGKHTRCFAGIEGPAQANFRWVGVGRIEEAPRYGPTVLCVVPPTAAAAAAAAAAPAPPNVATTKRTVHKRFVGSKFVLNTRDLKEWVKSVFMHRNVPGRIDTTRMFRENGPTIAMRELISLRSAYHDDVLSYFIHHPQDLLIVDASKEGALEQLDAFVGWDHTHESGEGGDVPFHLNFYNDTTSLALEVIDAAAAEALAELAVAEAAVAAASKIAAAAVAVAEGAVGDSAAAAAGAAKVSVVGNGAAAAAAELEPPQNATPKGIAKWNAKLGSPASSVKMKVLTESQMASELQLAEEAAVYALEMLELDGVAEAQACPGRSFSL